MRYKQLADARRPRLRDKYSIVGFISHGTYGRVYKARRWITVENTNNSSSSSSASGPGGGGGGGGSDSQPATTVIEVEYAIKKFKPEKEDPAVQLRTGVSQSAIREVALCRELRHENIIRLYEVLIEDRSIHMVFEYAEYDLLALIQQHSKPTKRPMPESVIKSFSWQLLNGLAYLHANWILHRDLKPANLMISTAGVVKIGDLGLARSFKRPPMTLYNGDRLVVTVWYRAPELLLGARHYTTAIDVWATGCIIAEMLALWPIFRGEEEKMQGKHIPFQKSQVNSIIEHLGMPTVDRWPKLEMMPDYGQLHNIRAGLSAASSTSNLHGWFTKHAAGTAVKAEAILPLLSAMLEYDPERRITAQDALNHPYFTDGAPIVMNPLAVAGITYQKRRIATDEAAMRDGMPPVTAQQQQAQGPSSSIFQQQNQLHGSTATSIATGGVASTAHSNSQQSKLKNTIF
ncbi:Pkinase-domain-containing protein [Ramicandelaber brevisporus]|nr:Pkinase-domain-containing protein [Ramicandelaber brevisporus]